MMRMGSSLGLVGVLALGLLACGDDDGGDDPTLDAGPSPDGGTAGGGGSGGSGGSGGAGGSAGTPSVMPLTCGGAPCMVSAGAAMLGASACCTSDDRCGGMSLLATECIPLGASGNYDETCPPLSLGGVIDFPGCCTPAGECGALDSSQGGFGCIPGDALAMAPDGGVGQSCDYDPDATCTSILAVYCDGPEDCGSGKQCCGRFGGGGYDSFSCEDSCVELAAQGEIWSEICHPGQECDQPLPTDGGTMMMGGPMTLPDGGVIAYECRQSDMYLPDFLFRCRDTGTEPEEAGSVASGEINCGSSTCGSGQKCCYALDPGAAASAGNARCVDADEACTCGGGSSGDDGGTEDGG
jgi:hypothetical protein